MEGGSIYSAIWEQCLESLQDELSMQQFNTWIRPLEPQTDTALPDFCLLAPNRFISDWVNDKYSKRIQQLIIHYCSKAALSEPSSILILASQRPVTDFHKARIQVPPVTEVMDTTESFARK